MTDDVEEGKKSALLILKASIESFLPWDLEWLEVLAEHIQEFRENFSWDLLGKRLGKLAISLLVVYLLWDFFAPFREIAYELELIFVMIYIEFFLVFLPLMLFFSTLTWFGVFWRFCLLPKDHFKALSRATWSCLWLWIIFLINMRYGEIINEFLQSL